MLKDSARVSKDERTLIIPVFTQVKIYHTGLGFTELRDDWGKTALENILKVLAGELRSKGIELRNYIIPTGMENEFDEVKALYLSVSGSMNYRYPEGAASVDFTVGPIRDFLVESDSKYLLFVHALDKVVTGGRKATKVFTTFLGVDPLKWGDITAVDIGLLNSSGKVVWHGMKWSGGRTICVTSRVRPVSCYRC